MNINHFGASFSLHRSNELGLDSKALLLASIDDLNLRRFRLMSYWNLHEPSQGQYDFFELDWQMDMIAVRGGQVSLAIGKRQPRWPECHMPKWALELPQNQWYDALFQYIKVVVERYKDHPALSSWQLENEALLKDFGICKDGDYSRLRLEAEFKLVRQLDPTHPIIMTLSDSWGLPLHRPRPDAYAMTIYPSTIGDNGQYRQSVFPPQFYSARAKLIKLYTGKEVFVHELQAEPWVNRAIADVPVNEQLKLMNPVILETNARLALKTGMRPIDLWGLEWWYWLRQQHGNEEMWQTVKKIIASSD